MLLASFVAATEIETVERPGAVTCPIPSMQPHVASLGEKRQPARQRNDPNLSFSVRITPATEPRRVHSRRRRLQLLLDRNASADTISSILSEWACRPELTSRQKTSVTKR